MKAENIKALYHAQKRTERIHHKTARRICTGFAAAAVTLAFCAVTVGAFNDWNYPAVFNRYFSFKSGEPVDFDFSGMGMDIGQTFQGDGFTLTIQSLVADATAVYVTYDIDLSDENDAILAPYDYIVLSGGLMGEIEKPGETGTYSPMIHDMNAVRDENNIYHAMLVMHMDYGTSLADKQVTFHPNDVSAYYNYDEEGRGTMLTLPAAGEPLVYSLSDVQVQEGYTVPYGGILPNDANENLFETMDVTPFMLKFTHYENTSAYESAPKWGITPKMYAVDVTYTALYADGSEVPIHIVPHEGITGNHSSRLDDGSYACQVEWCRYFSVPLSMDGLTAIRINDTVIPVA